MRGEEPSNLLDSMAVQAATVGLSQLPAEFAKTIDSVTASDVTQVQ